MESKDYPEPLDQLLTLGEIKMGQGWRDYAALGIGPEHVNDLIRMATDRELHWAVGEDPRVYAPVHAWRALGQLRATRAVQPLLDVLAPLQELDDDWSLEEVPVVIGMIGPSAIPVVQKHLANRTHDLYVRNVGAVALKEIAARNPDSFAECKSILTRQLEKFADEDAELNAFIICELLDLQATESLPVIRNAFLAGHVDETIVHLSSVFLELGIEPDAEDQELIARIDGRGPRFDSYIEEFSAHQQKKISKRRAKAKAVRAQKKRQRKRRRKRK